VPLAYSASDVAYIALTIFLVATGLGIAYAFFRLGDTFAKLSSFIRGTEQEVLPVINKAGGTIDRVNHQLDKLDEATDSAVDAVEAVDQAVRAVSFAVKTPVKKSAGFAAAISNGFATLRARRDWRAAKRSAKEAAARREADLEEELRKARVSHPRPPEPVVVQPTPPTPPSQPPPGPATSPPEGGIFGSDRPL
jgi:uncharacterized protein YoxC